MTITMFRNKGPLIRDGYQIIRCDTPGEALLNVNRAFWPVKWKEDIAAGIPPVLGTDPVVTLNNEFNKNGYWFLDYWDEAWPLMRNEAIANVLREHFEGETCEAPKDVPETILLRKRPYRVAVTSVADETNVRYFDSMHQVGEFVRDLAFKQGGTAGRNALEKVLLLGDRLALYGWILNGETDNHHWVERAFNYLLNKANIDDFERCVIEGLHAHLYEGDNSAETLRDLFVNGPLAVD